MGALKFKFKRRETPKNELLGQAFKLGLQNEPSFTGANCCFVKNGWISFGEVGSDGWDNADVMEISEGDFMSLVLEPPQESKLLNKPSMNQ